MERSASSSRDELNSTSRGAETSDYSYKPLHSENAYPIRLLQLRKAPKFSDDIQCEIWETALSLNVTFEALSYTWGDDSTGIPPCISLIDCENNSKFSITSNLEAALRHLRYVDQDRVLWIDAVCINQGDEDEKSKQIAHMRLIYTYAKRVVVWLGEEGDAKLALSHSKRLESAHIADTALRKGLFDDLSPADALAGILRSPPKRHRYFRMPILLTYYNREWAACDELFRRSWWTRSWTLQEVMHAGPVLVHIGRIEISLDDLCERLESLRRCMTLRNEFKSKGNIPVPSDEGAPLFTSYEMDYAAWIKASGSLEAIVTTIPAFRQRAQAATADPGYENWPPRLAEMLLNVRNQKAKEKRDKIWAFVGMAKQEYNLDAARDYARLSWDQLYTLVAKFMLSRSLLILLWVESLDRSMTDEALPSWVPDHSQRQTFVSRVMVSSWSLFHADANFPAIEREPRHLHFERHPESPTLILRGIQFGTITDTKAVAISNDDGTALNLIRYMVRQGENGEQVVTQHEAVDAQARWENASFKNTNWGPLNVKRGDILIISPGSTIPLVLRKIEQSYKYVGGCWLIVRELQDPTKLEVDPGFSDIMFGSVCSATNRMAQVELFEIS